MEYKLTVEVRPRLRACQFYITAKEKLCVNQLKILKNSVIFHLGNSQVEFQLDGVNLIPETMSGLSIGTCSICFRCQCEPCKMYGSFKTEILPVNKPAETLVQYIPPVEKNVNYHIFCSCCFHKLTENEIVFTRILPLPTGNFDSVDLFCHGTNKEVFNIGPRKNDCLYGNFFFKVDRTLINCEGNILHCKRCFSWLGTRDASSVVLWNSTVLFDTDRQVDIQEVSLHDFISVVKSTMAEGSGFCKILMYSRVTEDQTNYLLLWVLEGNLELLVSSEIVSGPLKLDKKNVIKVLYRFEKECSKEMELSEKDIYVHKIAVSKQMLTQGLKHMNKMSSYISDEYKSTNNMFVSYIEDSSCRAN